MLLYWFFFFFSFLEVYFTLFCILDLASAILVITSKSKFIGASSNHLEFQALDFVVSEARKYKIRLILSLVNNWDAYGGKPQYVKWGKAAGLNLTSDDEFFSHPTLRSYYKAHVKASS